MTQAYNLSQVANFANSNGQIDASAGLFNTAPSAAALISNNFSIIESSGKLIFYFGATAIASMDSSGNLTQLQDVTAYGTP
jgi:hypothetical protein